MSTGRQSVIGKVPGGPGHQDDDLSWLIVFHRRTETCRYLELYVGTVISRKLNGINIPEPPQSLTPTSAASDASSSPKGELKDITLLATDATARLQHLRDQARSATLPLKS